MYEKTEAKHYTVFLKLTDQRMGRACPPIMNRIMTLKYSTGMIKFY